MEPYLRAKRRLGEAAVKCTNCPVSAAFPPPAPPFPNWSKMGDLGTLAWNRDRITERHMFRSFEGELFGGIVANHFGDGVEKATGLVQSVFMVLRLGHDDVDATLAGSGRWRERESPPKKEELVKMTLEGFLIKTPEVLKKRLENIWLKWDWISCLGLD